ncbi:MAG: hypothetical protein LBQ02_00170 [Candidatus Nomurabacteria bacterium]|jgi:hypothetical protein|nr:hypothetical protein [Candidatus Nomurabacteria bacterium]
MKSDELENRKLEKMAVSLVYRESNQDEIALIFGLWPVVAHRLATGMSEMSVGSIRVSTAGINKYSGWLVMGLEFLVERGAWSKANIERRVEEIINELDFDEHNIQKYTDCLINLFTFPPLYFELASDPSIKHFREVFTVPNTRRVLNKLKIAVGTVDF